MNSRLDTKGRTATAGAFRVRVGHDETRTFQTFGIVNGTADQILQAHRINHQANALFFDGHIAFVHLIIKGETILETATTATGNINA